MGPANSKDKDEHQTRQERSPAAIEGYSINFEKHRSAGRILARKGQHLDVDGILSRSFKDVNSTVCDEPREE